MAKDNLRGSNLNKLNDDIVKGIGQIEGLKDKRAAINEKIAAVRSDLEAKGIKKAALDMAMTYLNWDEDKREGFDIAYQIVRDAMDAPLVSTQMDMSELMADKPKEHGDKTEGEA